MPVSLAIDITCCYIRYKCQLSRFAFVVADSLSPVGEPGSRLGGEKVWKHEYNTGDTSVTLSGITLIRLNADTFEWPKFRLTLSHSDAASASLAAGETVDGQTQRPSCLLLSSASFRTALGFLGTQCHRNLMTRRTFSVNVKRWVGWVGGGGNLRLADSGKELWPGSDYKFW
jgi:hypothetical protein